MFLIEQTRTAAVEAPLNELALKMLISTPAESTSVFNHLDKAEVETLRKVGYENKNPKKTRCPLDLFCTQNKVIRCLNNTMFWIIKTL